MQSGGWRCPKGLVLLAAAMCCLLPQACAQRQEETAKAPATMTTTGQALPQGSGLPVTDFSTVAEGAIDAVVHIKTRMSQLTPLYQSFFGLIIPQGVQRQEYEAYGSGVIVTTDGYIVTNNHVVQDAESISVTLNDRRELAATLVGHDPATDLAVIKIDAEGLDYLPFGNSDAVRVGEPVLAIGNPFNLTSTVTGGIISAKARNMHIIDNPRTGETPLESFLQTDAAVNSGNSGGALVNARGELIGIVTAIASGNGGNYIGYSFAIPSNIAVKVAGDLRRYGRVQRAYLGVQVTEVDAEVARRTAVRDLKGLYIAQVTPQCAADRAGMRAGDVIVRVAGKEVNTFAEMMEELGLFNPGDEVEVDYVRDGKSQTARVRLLNSKGTTETVRE